MLRCRLEYAQQLGRGEHVIACERRFVASDAAPRCLRDRRATAQQCSAIDTHAFYAPTGAQSSAGNNWAALIALDSPDCLGVLQGHSRCAGVHWTAAPAKGGDVAC